MAWSESSTVEVEEGGATTISAVHPDILQTHILTRLDGPTLASASSACSQLYALSAGENLWREICRATWPSMNNPRMRHLISTFPNGSRSFFSDAFPLLDFGPYPPPQNPHPPSFPQGLISAVDIHYQNKSIFSKIHDTETLTNWFQSSPFRIDLIDPKDTIAAPIHPSLNTCRDLAEGLRLSWIVIDPIGRRAANLSSWRPVSVQRHWMSGEAQVRFATVLAGDGGSSSELVQCGIVVTCGGCETGEMHVREVYLQVEDMDGKNLNGKDSLDILQKAMVQAKRKDRKKKEEVRERYDGFMKMKRERNEKRVRREGNLEFMFITFTISIFAGLWMFVSFC